MDSIVEEMAQHVGDFSNVAKKIAVTLPEVPRYATLEQNCMSLHFVPFNPSSVPVGDMTVHIWNISGIDRVKNLRKRHRIKIAVIVGP